MLSSVLPDIRHQVQVLERRNVAALEHVPGGDRCQQLPDRRCHGHVDAPDGISRRQCYPGAGNQQIRVESDEIPGQSRRQIRRVRESIRVVTQSKLYASLVFA